MQKLPIGIYDFKDLILDKYIYVDKTKYILELINSGKLYFLSRLRRFGKSLTVSTLYHLFNADKELFEGLYIYDKWNWNEKYPVIRISMSQPSSDLKYLEKDIILMLDNICKENNIKPIKTGSVKARFVYLIQQIYQKSGKQVVVLVDEYDKPILENMHSLKAADTARKILADFYEVLKDQSDKIRFLFITGISKFSKVSIFSKLNNLQDLTLHHKYGVFLGYTEDEIKEYFSEYIDELTKHLNTNRNNVLKMMKLWYDGYNFNSEERVYNPFSILNLFSELEFKPFWFESGTPSFLVKYVKEKGGIKELSEAQVRYEDFSAQEIEDATLPIFLYQAGYFTIKNAGLVEMLAITN